MAAIQQSRLWNNLWRDLNNDYQQDESLSILNTSSQDIEVTDSETGITKIIYPRTALHTNRPAKSIIITQHGDKPIKAIISRSTIKKDIIAIETPTKFSNSTDTYNEFLSMNWINKVLQTADRIIITTSATYYIANNDVLASNWLVICLLLVVVAICFALILV